MRQKSIKAAVRILKPMNKSYRVDETYIKVKGKDRYLYRAVWMFQDVLPDGHADRAGVRPGAQLLAVDGITATGDDIPRYRPTNGGS